MDFLLWAALSLHLFSVVVWLGSLCFLSAAVYPVLAVENKSMSPFAAHLHRRGLPFVWLSVWSIGITGAALAVFSPLLLYDRTVALLWSPLGIKIILYTGILLLSLRLRTAYRGVYGAGITGDESGTHMATYKRLVKTIRLNILLGIGALLMAAWR
jgi:uncharacterized membrane protein